MAKKIMVDIAPIIEKIKAYKTRIGMYDFKGNPSEFINGCITLCVSGADYQLELRKREYQGMLNDMRKAYERIQETTDPINFGDFEAIILDHLVASNNFLATQIEELENCSPDDFKQMALVLAKKEL